MTYAERLIRCRLAVVLVFGAALTSCGSGDLLAPGANVNGVWRGSEWGLEATDYGAALHHACGNEAQIEVPLVWDRDLRFSGTAEWPWNAQPGADLLIVARALQDGRIVITIEGLYGRTDTLRRAPRAAFWPEVVCD